MSVPVVTLRPKHDRRARQGHPWVFSNEIAEPAAELPVGGMVDVVDAKGAFVARGYSNPNSLIAVRCFARRDQDIDQPGFWVSRLREALDHRRALFGDRRDLRLVFSEGDRAPGLVIDRFDDVLAVQLTTLGLERRKDVLEEAIRAV